MQNKTLWHADETHPHAQQTSLLVDERSLTSSPAHPTSPRPTKQKPPTAKRSGAYHQLSEEVG